MFFGPNGFFGGEDRQILDLVFKIAPISDHVTKFRGDRPRDCRDLELNKKRKKEKKETAAMHKGRSRVALSQRAALINAKISLTKLKLGLAEQYGYGIRFEQSQTRLIFCRTMHRLPGTDCYRRCSVNVKYYTPFSMTL